MEALPRPEPNRHRRGVELAVALVLSFVDIRASWSDAAHSASGRDWLLSGHRSYPTPAPAHLAAEVLDKELQWTLHTIGIYNGVLVRQTRRTPPELVAKPAAFSRRFAHLPFL